MMNHLNWIKFILSEGRVPRLDPKSYGNYSTKYVDDFIQYYENKYFKKWLHELIEKYVVDNFNKMSQFYTTEIIHNIKRQNSYFSELSTKEYVGDVIKAHLRKYPSPDPISSLGLNLYYKFLRSYYQDRFDKEYFYNSLQYEIGSISSFYYLFCLKNPNKAYSIPSLNRPDFRTQNRKDNIAVLQDKTRFDPDKLGNSSILDDVKITEYLSRGAYGIVYKLEDDRVLKIFRDSVNLKKDLERMDITIKELFTAPKENEEQKLSSGEMPFFDYGKLGNTGYYYAIMPWIIPIQKAPWYDKSPVFEMVADMNQELSRSLESQDRWDTSYNDYKEIVLRRLAHASKFRLIGKQVNDVKTYSNTIEKIIKASYRAFKKFKGTDTHSGNIGYLPQKPNQLFYFDM